MKTSIAPLKNILYSPLPHYPLPLREREDKGEGVHSVRFTFAGEIFLIYEN